MVAHSGVLPDAPLKLESLDQTKTEHIGFMFFVLSRWYYLNQAQPLKQGEEIFLTYPKFPGYLNFLPIFIFASLLHSKSRKVKLFEKKGSLYSFIPSYC